MLPRKEGRHDMTYRQWLNVVKWIDAQCHYIHAREEMEQSAAYYASETLEACKVIVDDLESFVPECYPKFVQRAYAYAKEVLNGSN